MLSHRKANQGMNKKGIYNKCRQSLKNYNKEYLLTQDKYFTLKAKYTLDKD